jgi:hypothetical protein
VAQWIVEGHSHSDIIHNVTLNWGIEERQAKNYIARALELFVEENNVELKGKIAFHQKARLDNYRTLVDQRNKVIKSSDIAIYAKVKLTCMISNQINATLKDMAKIDGLFVDKVDHTTKGEKLNNGNQSFEVLITPTGTTVKSSDTTEK